MCHSCVFVYSASCLPAGLSVRLFDCRFVCSCDDPGWLNQTTKQPTGAKATNFPLKHGKERGEGDESVGLKHSKASDVLGNPDNVWLDSPTVDQLFTRSTRRLWANSHYNRKTHKADTERTLVGTRTTAIRWPRTMKCIRSLCGGHHGDERGSLSRVVYFRDNGNKWVGSSKRVAGCSA